MRAALAGGPKGFGELWAAVELAGGSKFALRSALGKARDRGEVEFNGQVYAASDGTPKARKPTGPKPGGRAKAGVPTF